MHFDLDNWRVDKLAAARLWSYAAGFDDDGEKIVFAKKKIERAAQAGKLAIDGVVDGKNFFAIDGVIAAIVQEALDRHSPAPSVLLGEDGSEIDIDLERARKLQAERILLDLKAAEIKGEVAPLDLMRVSLRDCLQTANSFLESIPSAIRRVAPEVPGSALDAVERECAKVRNSIADGRITFTDERMAGYSREPMIGNSDE